jgi:protein TonB
MMEGAFYQQKKGSPTALAVVVLMHGAALTALAMAKSEVIRDAITRTKVVNIKEKEPPPPEKVKPIEKSATPPKTVITHVPPIVDMPLRPDFVESDPLPRIQPIEIARPDPIPIPRADPPAKIEARTVEPARARANLASYVSDEDYPGTAVRNEEQGTTRFRLTVGADGKVKECSVTASSGSSSLDATTCKLMKQRAKFTPAKNNRGEPTGDTVASAIRWVLPTD